eukprot:1151913-Pelagomonas_calceolata.AAC.9
MHCSMPPRAKAGLRMLEASRPPSDAPAPTAAMPRAHDNRTYHATATGLQDYRGGQRVFGHATSTQVLQSGFVTVNNKITLTKAFWHAPSTGVEAVEKGPSPKQLNFWWARSSDFGSVKDEHVLFLFRACSGSTTNQRAPKAQAKQQPDKHL